MATIVLDPGHGGVSTIGNSSWNNAVGPRGTLEKTLTLDVALLTRDELEARGHRVELTRDRDVNLGLDDRAHVARDLAAPVFVSIHFNGYPTPVQGTETFVHTTHRTISADLCRAVQAAVVAATGHDDRNRHHPGGVKRAGFGVLSRSSHHANTACVLLEVSFMHMSDEEERLLTSAYKRRIAMAIADGIDNYLSEAGSALGIGNPEILGDGFELSASLSIAAPEIGLFEDGFDSTGYDAPRGRHMIVEETWEDGVRSYLIPVEQLDAEIEEGDEGLAAALDAGPQATLSYSNQNAIRNKPCTANVERRLVSAVTAVFGPSCTVSIYSGGQDRLGQGNRRTGSVRHDDFGNGGRAADVYVYDENGAKLKGLTLAKLGQYWLASGFGGVGLEMAVGGIHLDEWTTPPQGGGMYWTYAYSNNQSWGAEARRMLRRGVNGEFPELFQESDTAALSTTFSPALPARVFSEFPSMEDNFDDYPTRLVQSDANLRAGATSLQTDYVEIPSRLYPNGGGPDLEIGDFGKDEFLTRNRQQFATLVEDVNNWFSLPADLAFSVEEAYGIIYAEIGLMRNGNIDPKHDHLAGEFGLLPLSSAHAAFTGAGAPNPHLLYRPNINVQEFLLYLGSLRIHSSYAAVYRYPGISGSKRRITHTSGAVVHGYFYSPNYRPPSSRPPRDSISREIAADRNLADFMEGTSFKQRHVIRNRVANINDGINMA